MIQDIPRRYFQRLEHEFDSDDLFMDVEGHISPGDDFVDVLGEQVAACDILLAVIGPRWVELMAARATELDDFVAIEIKAALDKGKRIIPVLVGGASVPLTDALPESIRALSRRNAFSLRPESFKADCQRLVSVLRGQLAATRSEDRTRSETTQGAIRAAPRHSGAEGPVYSQSNKALSVAAVREAEEIAHWDFIKESADARALRNHLKRFPNGVTAIYAVKKLEELQRR
jgi:hypothetical protein